MVKVLLKKGIKILRQLVLTISVGILFFLVIERLISDKLILNFLVMNEVLCSIKEFRILLLKSLNHNFFLIQDVYEC